MWPQKASRSHCLGSDNRDYCSKEVPLFSNHPSRAEASAIRSATVNRENAA